MDGNPVRRTDLRRAVDLIETDLAAAHRIAQQYEGDPSADAIHAIIHRREGDFGNSIYWWRRVGHALSAQVADAYPDGDPVAFVQKAKSAPKGNASIAAVESAELAALRSFLAEDEI